MVFTIQCSTLSPSGRKFIFLICDGSIRDLEGNLGKNKFICF